MCGEDIFTKDAANVRFSLSGEIPTEIYLLHDRCLTIGYLDRGEHGGVAVVKRMT